MLTNIYSGNKAIAIAFYSLIFFVIFDYLFAFTVFKSQMIIFFFMIFNMLSFIYCVFKFGSEFNQCSRLWMFYIGFHIVSLALNGNISTIPYWVISLLLLFLPEKVIGVFRPSIFVFIGLFFAIGVFFQYLFPSFYFTFVFPLFISDASEFIESSLNNEFGFSGFSPQTGTTAYLLLICQSVLLSFDKEEGFLFKKWTKLGLLTFFILAIFLTGKRMPSAISIILLLATIHISSSGNTIRNIFLFLFLFFCCYMLLEYFIANINQYSESIFLKRFVTSFNSASSGADITSGRSELYDKALYLFGNEPVLGIGANNFSKIGGMGTSIHNTYLQVLCEEGILRFPLFIIPLTVVFVMTLRELLSNTFANYHNILLLSFLLQIVFVLYSFTGNTIVNISNFVFYFMAVGLYAHVSNLKYQL